MIAAARAVCGADCDCIRFSDRYWYKFTQKAVTKEGAIRKACEICGVQTEEIMAFGDDYADIVIGGNDEEGIADYWERYLQDC